MSAGFDILESCSAKFSLEWLNYAVYAISQDLSLTKLDKMAHICSLFPMSAGFDILKACFAKFSLEWLNYAVYAISEDFCVMKLGKAGGRTCWMLQGIASPPCAAPLGVVGTCHCTP